MNCGTQEFGCGKSIGASRATNVIIYSNVALCQGCASSASESWGVELPFIRDLDWAIGHVRRAMQRNDRGPVSRSQVYDMLRTIGVPFDREKAKEREAKLVAMGQRELPEGDRLL